MCRSRGPCRDYLSCDREVHAHDTVFVEPDPVGVFKHRRNHGNRSKQKAAGPLCVLDGSRFFGQSNLDGYMRDASRMTRLQVVG